jgi:hypothetical protein
MTTKAKLSVLLAVVAMPWGVATVGLAGHMSWLRHRNNVDAAQDTDGAYRDGFFLGELDARQGRKVKPSIGRWNTEKDRASFKAGYEKGYRGALASTNAAHPR